MNPSRYFNADPLIVAGVVVLALLILAVYFWTRQRERRGDRGPGLIRVPARAGYSPMDLRAGAAATVVDDPADRWLLGLAAPFVEQERLLHDRWSLVPAFCDEAWRRRLVAVAAQWGVVRSREWKREVAELERRLTAPGWTFDGSRARAWLTARLAMLLRLGVAARHTSATRARRRLARAAAPLRSVVSDWIGYGDMIIATAAQIEPERTIDLRADLRMLYADGGPWHGASWPEAV